ncbi:MAG: Hsp20/alpha crystallin family protein [Anaerolineales bacterium]|jgi:HSP20 family protein
MVKVEVEFNPIKPSWKNPDGSKPAGFKQNWHLGSAHLLWSPPTDVYETKNAIIVRVEIAGMRNGDFSISLNNRHLIIQGFRPDQPERRAFQQMEIRFGEFRTDVELPIPIRADEIEASYDDGFLRVILPKAKSRRIWVQASDD